MSPLARVMRPRTALCFILSGCKGFDFVSSAPLPRPRISNVYFTLLTFNSETNAGLIGTRRLS
jgi:hypothetical protein